MYQWHSLRSRSRSFWHTCMRSRPSRLTARDRPSSSRAVRLSPGASWLSFRRAFMPGYAFDYRASIPAVRHFQFLPNLGCSLALKYAASMKGDVYPSSLPLILPPPDSHTLTNNFPRCASYTRSVQALPSTMSVARQPGCMTCIGLAGTILQVRTLMADLRMLVHALTRHLAPEMRTVYSQPAIQPQMIYSPQLPPQRHHLSRLNRPYYPPVLCCDTCCGGTCCDACCDDLCCDSCCGCGLVFTIHHRIALSDLAISPDCCY